MARTVARLWASRCAWKCNRDRGGLAVPDVAGAPLMLGVLIKLVAKATNDTYTSDVATYAGEVPGAVLLRLRCDRGSDYASAGRP